MRLTKKLLILGICLASSYLIFGQGQDIRRAGATAGQVSTNSFSPNQFTVSGSSNITIKSGAIITNANLVYDNVTDRNFARTNLDVLWSDDSLAGLQAKSSSGGYRIDANAALRFSSANTLPFSTNNFSLMTTIKLGDYTPVTQHVIFQSHTAGNNRVQFVLTTTGIFRLIFTDNAGATSNFDITPDSALVDSQTYNIILTASRSTLMGDGLAYLYINGSADRNVNATLTSVDISAASGIDIGNGNANNWAAIGDFNGTVYNFAVFNKVLSSSQAMSYARYSDIIFSEQWGTFTAAYTANWSAGVDSWSTVTGVTSAGNVDGISDGVTTKNDNLSITSDASNGAHVVTRGATLTFGKRYRAEMWYYIPNSNVTMNQVAVGFGATPNTTSPLVLSPTGTVKGTWTFISGEIFYAGSAALTSARFTGLTSTGLTSFTGTAGDVIYLNGLIFTEIGALVDLDIDNGNPSLTTTTRDRSSNNYNVTASTGVTQIKNVPNFSARYGFFGGTTETASTPVETITQTFNNAGVTFAGVKYNFVDTSSAAGSMFVDYQISSSSKASILKTGQGIFKGTVLADDPTAGNLGEVISSLIAVGSATSLTTATAKNVTSISLTAGDWDVSGNINFSAATATVTATSGGITVTTATVPTDGTEVYSGVQVTLLSEFDSVTIPTKRINVSSTTTVFLVGKCTFSAGTVSAFGAIRARRIR